MTNQAFVEAILAHLRAGFCLFHKTISSPPTDTIFFDANIARDAETHDEGQDVYVEIRLRGQMLVIICDAHCHTRGKPRLPK